ncbi:hypothetical protein BH11PLA1_BH11PLA1_13040 [soil metagenome]
MNAVDADRWEGKKKKFFGTGVGGAVALCGWWGAAVATPIVTLCELQRGATALRA